MKKMMTSSMTLMVSHVCCSQNSKEKQTKATSLVFSARKSPSRLQMTDVPRQKAFTVFRKEGRRRPCQVVASAFPFLTLSSQGHSLTLLPRLPLPSGLGSLYQTPWTVQRETDMANSINRNIAYEFQHEAGACFRAQPVESFKATNNYYWNVYEHQDPGVL